MASYGQCRLQPTTWTHRKDESRVALDLPWQLTAHKVTQTMGWWDTYNRVLGPCPLACPYERIIPQYSGHFNLCQPALSPAPSSHTFRPIHSHSMPGALAFLQARGGKQISTVRVLVSSWTWVLVNSWERVLLENSWVRVLVSSWAVYRSLVTS